MSIVFSCVIPARDPSDPKLADLIASIKAQNFPQDQIEILVITEGDSEQAKAIGIRRAKGEICAMFCADNQIMEKDLFSEVYRYIKKGAHAVYPFRYFYNPNDNSLNRYFSLIGGNDPICYYLGKNDRKPHAWNLVIKSNYPSSYGCNGTFYKSEIIKKTNLDHYYPMDNAMETGVNFVAIPSEAIWHRTSDNLLTFLIKRYRYARDLYCDREDRRWKMLDTKEDYWRLGLYILYVLTIIQPLSVSVRLFGKTKDWAAFWHWPVCFGFLITYTILVCRNLLKHRSLFQRSAGEMHSKGAFPALSAKR